MDPAKRSVPFPPLSPGEEGISPAGRVCSSSIQGRGKGLRLTRRSRPPRMSPGKARLPVRRNRPRTPARETRLQAREKRAAASIRLARTASPSRPYQTARKRTAAKKRSPPQPRRYPEARVETRRGVEGSEWGRGGFIASEASHLCGDLPISACGSFQRFVISFFSFLIFLCLCIAQMASGLPLFPSPSRPSPKAFPNRSSPSVKALRGRYMRVDSIIEGMLAKQNNGGYG